MTSYEVASVAVIILAVASIMLAAIVGVENYEKSYARKLCRELGLRRWYRIETLVELGYSRARCENSLPLLHKEHLLEVRPERPGAGAFTIATVEDYSFQLVRRGENDGGGGHTIRQWLQSLPPSPTRAPAKARI